MSNTQIILLANLVAMVLYLGVCAIIRNGFLWSLFTPAVFTIVNILLGIIFLGINRKAGKAFLLVGIVGLLIGCFFYLLAIY